MKVLHLARAQGTIHSHVPPAYCGGIAITLHAYFQAAVAKENRSRGRIDPPSRRTYRPPEFRPGDATAAKGSSALQSQSHTENLDGAHNLPACPAETARAVWAAVLTCGGHPKRSSNLFTTT